jgi:hypothetical protein
VNFLEVLKECEPVVSQICRDAGVSRQAVYLWKDGLPRRGVFKKLSEMDKYKKTLSRVDYESLREASPLGRRVG